MPKRKTIVKAPTSRIKDDSRLMLTHETMVDFIKVNAPHHHHHHHHHHQRAADSFMNVLTSGIFDFGAYNLDDDLINSDDDDDDEGAAATRLLQPHPRIRQLTEEEAEKHAAELLAEEERRKEKTEKNKRKKMRKKEKKRLKKENALKNNLPEEEQGQSDSDSENEEDNPIIQSNTEGNEEEQSHDAPAAAACDENSAENNNEEEETEVKISEKEDEEEKELDFNHSNSRLAEFGSAASCEQRPEEREKDEHNEFTVVQEKPKVVGDKAEVKKREEDDEETSTESTLEELAERSRELARSGNRLAAAGQYEMAVKCFTDAIKFNPKEFRLFGNRSLCFERMQQHDKALRDADVALSMEPNWIKGLFRKGKALCGLKKYYEASLVYRAVLNLETYSAEAAQELKRAQTLHLMEMGFSWAQSNEALRVHATLEGAVEALFAGVTPQGAAGSLSSLTGASRDDVVQPVVREGETQDGQWTVRQSNRTRTQHVKHVDASVQSASQSQSPAHPVKNPGRGDRFSIWVGSLSPTVTYPALHQLFSRVGAVHGIKMLLEHQCAFVHYIRKEDCERAIHSLNGMVFEGTPLSVRYPIRGHSEASSRGGPHQNECFFWRTSGCTRQDCTFTHVPEHKNIDRLKFTSRLGRF